MNADRRRFLRTRRSALRLVCVATLLSFLTLFALSSGQTARGGIIPDAPPTLVHGEMECTTGFSTPADAPDATDLVPDGWTRVVITGTPTISSARMFFTGGCDNDAFVEHLEGDDALVVRSQDIETPPVPGKPFDVVFYQQIAVQPGGDYSLSAWLLSLCGGSAVPSDCPSGYYIDKLLGIDATGGVDPLASSVMWVKNRRNFMENGRRIGWQNLRLAARAQSETLTVFVRVRSPFQWHGNHAFIDGVSLVRAPQVSFATLPQRVPDSEVTLAWRGQPSPDAAAIEGGTYALRYDVQMRINGGTWRNWRTNLPSTRVTYTASVAEQPHDFRVRARSVQPPEPAPESTGGEVRGAWPNHRYPGVWSTPQRVVFGEAAAVQRVYLPAVLSGR